MGLGDLIPEEYRAPGLTAVELETAQAEAGALFPPDLCELLAETLPVGAGNRADDFPDWRHRPREAMDAWRNGVVDAFHFDVVENDFWLREWGDRPDDSVESRAIVAARLAEAPVLVPIYIHRAIPNEPLEAGNPVFSVWAATDTIVYGADLRDYLLSEFHEEGRSPGRKRRTIRFWTDSLEFSDERWSGRE